MTDNQNLTACETSLMGVGLKIQPSIADGSLAFGITSS